MQIKFSKRSRKTLNKLQVRISHKLVNSIENIPEGDIKPLKGKKTPPLFRLRVGKFRILFCTEEDFLKIIKIDTRGDVYK